MGVFWRVFIFSSAIFINIYGFIFSVSLFRAYTYVCKTKYLSFIYLKVFHKSYVLFLRLFVRQFDPNRCRIELNYFFGLVCFLALSRIKMYKQFHLRYISYTVYDNIIFGAAPTHLKGKQESPERQIMIRWYFHYSHRLEFVVMRMRWTHSVKAANESDRYKITLFFWRQTEV